MPDKPAPLTVSELAELARLAAEATPGPWTTGGPDSIGQWQIFDDAWEVANATAYSPKERRYGAKHSGPNAEEADANAAFIAASRSAVPRLLATVTALQADVDRLRARTHEIQAEESRRNAANESQYVRVRNAIEAAQRWVSAGEWRHMSSVNAYALIAQQERIAALQDALRALVNRPLLPDAILSAHALLDDAPAPLASERPCVTCGHTRWHHRLERGGHCFEAGCGCAVYEASETDVGR